jgi:hypothetical protein
VGWLLCLGRGEGLCGIGKTIFTIPSYDRGNGKASMNWFCIALVYISKLETTIVKSSWSARIDY